MISPTPKPSKTDELLRLYAELAGGNGESPDEVSDLATKAREAEGFGERWRCSTLCERYTLHPGDSATADGRSSSDEPILIGPYQIEYEIGAAAGDRLPRD